jgi:hypothetical protein
MAQNINRLNRFATPQAIPGYIMCPNGGKVFYVCSLGVQDETTADIASELYLTLAAAMNACRSNRGDVIVVLPGHVENVPTTSPTFVNGITIIGIGNGAERAKFTWNATGSAWVIAANNVWIENIVMDCGQANGVTKAISITGTDVSFVGCEFITTTDSTHKATVVLACDTGSDRARIWGNKFRGAAGTLSTDVVKMVGANDQQEVVGNRMLCGATAGNGLIHVTGAVTNILIADNYCYATGASSTAAIKIDDVASDGLLANDLVAVTNNGTGNTQGVVFAGTTTTTIKAAQCFSDDEAGKNAILSPAAST